MTVGVSISGNTYTLFEDPTITVSLTQREGTKVFNAEPSVNLMPASGCNTVVCDKKGISQNPACGLGIVFGEFLKTLLEVQGLWLPQADTGDKV